MLDSTYDTKIILISHFDHENVKILPYKCGINAYHLIVLAKCVIHKCFYALIFDNISLMSRNFPTFSDWGQQGLLINV